MFRSKTILWGTGISLSGLILFELFWHKKHKKQLKNQKIYELSDLKDGRFNKLKMDLVSSTNKEKKYIIKGLRATTGSNSDSINLLLDILYKDILKKKIYNSPQLPLLGSFQFICSMSNTFYKNKLKSLYNFKEYHGICKIYILSSRNSKQSRGTFIFFTGLCGLLCQMMDIIKIIIDSGYDILIPVYCPSQVSLEHNLQKHHEYDFYNCIIEYLNYMNIYNIHIAAWSLGGVKYLGFESIIHNNEHNFNINGVYLFEPLLCSRSILDCFTMHHRPWKKSLNIINARTPHLNFKFMILNYFMSYFFHTILAYGTANSTDYLKHIEYKFDSKKYDYNRYLFVSRSDYLLNEEFDKNFINMRFSKQFVFYRNGYHGGWLSSQKLKSTFGMLIKN